MSPTAPVAIPASRRTASANGTWKPGPAGIFACGKVPPEEQSSRSTPRVLRSFASATVCGRSQPPDSAQSVADTRTHNGNRSGQTARTASITSNKGRLRFSNGPPYRSVR